MKNGMHVDEWSTKSWFKDGQYHREDGPAIITAAGTKRWYLNGMRHREDGPAVIWAGGSKTWFKNDKCHREDGPAVIWADGQEEWWLNHEEYSFDEWLEKMNFSDEDKLILTLKWG